MSSVRFNNPYELPKMADIRITSLEKITDLSSLQKITNDNISNIELRIKQYNDFLDIKFSKKYSKEEYRIERKRRNAVLYPHSYTLNWYGLRKKPSDIGIEGYNWTTFYCLKRITNGLFPDDIMTYINQYLNWIPAGCWKIKNNWLNMNCHQCDYFPFISMRHLYSCSFDCYEKRMRNIILNDYSRFIKAINTIKSINNISKKRNINELFGFNEQYELIINNTRNDSKTLDGIYYILNSKIHDIDSVEYIFHQLDQLENMKITAVLDSLTFAILH